MTRLTFANKASTALKGADVVVLIAPRRMWHRGFDGGLPQSDALDLLRRSARDLEPGDAGAVTSTLSAGKSPKKILACVLPDAVSRHNSPSRAEAAMSLFGRVGLERSGKTAIIAGLDSADHLLAIANAAGRKIPLYSRKTNGSKPGSVAFAAVEESGKAIAVPKSIAETVEAARWAAKMVDTPPEEHSPADFAREAKQLVKGLAGVKVHEIKGKKLLDAGLRAVHAVGRAALVEPRLLVFDYAPAKAARFFAMVGKGVIYDTGGLSLKGKTAMPGMKGDMGGAAAVAGAFRALVAGGYPHRVMAVIPLVENAIGPASFRNDDIVEMHSGHTVEINNTDAEGRLILGDAVSWVMREHQPEAVLDAATLTGAQLVATGMVHAAVVSSRRLLEGAALEAGRVSGDLTHALPFAPELFQKEFASKVADMKNSVANRSNAQASCAAQFIWAQIDDLDPAWLHVDLAGPAWRGGRGTGFGVALLTEILRNLRKKDLAD